MQQAQCLFLKCVRILMEPVVFVQAARLDTHNFCSPGLKLGSRFCQVHNKLMVLLLASGKFLLPEFQVVHLR